MERIQKRRNGTKEIKYPLALKEENFPQNVIMG